MNTSVLASTAALLTNTADTDASKWATILAVAAARSVAASTSQDDRPNFLRLFLSAENYAFLLREGRWAPTVSSHPPAARVFDGLAILDDLGEESPEALGALVALARSEEHSLFAHLMSSAA